MDRLSSFIREPFIKNDPDLNSSDYLTRCAAIARKKQKVSIIDIITGKVALRTFFKKNRNRPEYTPVPLREASVLAITASILVGTTVYIVFSIRDKVFRNTYSNRKTLYQNNPNLSKSF